MTTLHVSPDLSLPLNTVTATTVIYGGKGMGKTNLGSVLMEELAAAVLELLGGVHGRVLKPLLEAYPHALVRESLAASAGYTNVHSKGFKNAIGRLRSLGFIDYPTPGQVQAQAILFLN